MLQKFVTEWNEALNSREVTSRFEAGDGSFKQQCVFKFREVEIFTQESWASPESISSITLFVQQTNKFINPKHANVANNMRWNTVAGVLKAITIGDKDEDREKLRYNLWLQSQLTNTLTKSEAKLKECGYYSDPEIQLFLPIIKLHVESGNITKAHLIVNILCTFGADLTAKGDTFYGNIDTYIDKMYGMFVSIVSKRYAGQYGYTLSIKDCNYLFLNKTNTENIPPVFKLIRDIVSQIHAACENSTNFLYVCDTLCAYYATVTCVPYEIKLAELQQRAAAAKARKEKYKAINNSSAIGKIGELPSVLDKLNIR